MRVFLILFPMIYVCCFGQRDAKNAQLLYDQANYAKAKECYLQLHKSEPLNALYIERLGDLCSRDARWEQALGYYEKWIGINPESANAHYKYGGALSMKASASNKLVALASVSKIRSCFEKAIVLDPRHVEARWALVEYYLQVPGIFGGSESKAKKYADELFRLSPVDHYLAKGRIEEYFGRLNNAREQYIQAHKIGNSKVTLKKLNAVRLKIRQRDQALKGD